MSIINNNLKRQQYLAMFDDMVEFVCRQDGDLKFLFANRAFTKFLGKNIEDLLGYNETELGIAHIDDIVGLVKGVKELTSQKPVDFFRSRYKNKAGEYVWVEWTIRGFFDKNGWLLECQSVGRDVTEHIKKQESLQGANVELEQRVRERTHALHNMVTRLDSTNKYLASILKNIDEGVAVTDMQGNIDYLNSVLEQEFGGSWPNFTQGFQAYINKGKDQHIKRMLKEQVAFYDVDLLFSSHGENFHCHMSGTAIESDRQNTKGVIILKPIKKVHNLVNRLSGSYALSTFDDYITKSPMLIQIKEDARLAATVDSNIIIEGESGTGKDVLAQAIHNASKRRNGPFIAINCGAIPRDLISSELFGYVEGAFTGAKKGGMPGKFELAEGGTLFLDEIGDMPLEQQIALLRVLQEKHTTRIGSHQAIPVDVRIICATHRNLADAINKGDFRQDLYYRLNVINFYIPSLRQRSEDISLLFSYFVSKLKGRTLNITSAVHVLLQQYDWPGNVRELQNAAERAVYFANNDEITPEHLPFNIREAAPKIGLSATLVSFEAADRSFATVKEIRTTRKIQAAEKECAEILTLLDLYKGNVSQVAKKMGLSRSTLYRKMQNYKLNKM